MKEIYPKSREEFHRMLDEGKKLYNEDGGEVWRDSKHCNGPYLFAYCGSSPSRLDTAWDDWKSYVYTEPARKIETRADVMAYIVKHPEECVYVRFMAGNWVLPQVHVYLSTIELYEFCPADENGYPDESKVRKFVNMEIEE